MSDAHAAHKEGGHGKHGDADTVFALLKKVFDWENNAEWQDLFGDYEGGRKAGIKAIGGNTVGLNRDEIVEKVGKYISAHDSYIRGTATSSEGKAYRQKLKSSEALSWLRTYADQVLKISEADMYAKLQKEGIMNVLDSYSNNQMLKDRNLYADYNIKKHVKEGDLDHITSLADKLIEERPELKGRKIDIIRNPIELMKNHFEHKFQYSGDVNKDYSHRYHEHKAA